MLSFVQFRAILAKIDLVFLYYVILKDFVGILSSYEEVGCERAIFVKKGFGEQPYMFHV